MDDWCFTIILSTNIIVLLEGTENWNVDLDYDSPCYDEIIKVTLLRMPVILLITPCHYHF